MDMDSNSKPIPKDLLPEVFEFSIGEALYIDCPVRWLPDLQVLAIGYGSDAKHVKVTDSQWRIFWLALNHVQVWRWDANYSDPFTLDGTSWNLKIKYRRKEIVSRGSNAYPESSGIDFSDNSQFSLFLDAVNMLAGTNYRV
jgi:hypothetical protein